jgi:hypothetical protein
MGDAGGSAKSLKMRSLKMVPIRRVPMSDVGPGSDRRELNGDQQDRRPNYPQQCAGRSHAQLLPYGPSERNSGSNCGKCMVMPPINGRTGR